jgi:hypothetical protein
VNEINGNGSWQVSSTSQWLLETGVTVFTHTRHLRSTGVVSELPPSSRDLVTSGAPFGRMLLEEPVLVGSVDIATCGTRNLISAFTTAKLNSPALLVAFYGLFGIYIVLISVFSVCSLRVCFH